MPRLARLRARTGGAYFAQVAGSRSALGVFVGAVHIFQDRVFGVGQQHTAVGAGPGLAGHPNPLPWPQVVMLGMEEDPDHARSGLNGAGQAGAVGTVVGVGDRHNSAKRDGKDARKRIPQRAFGSGQTGSAP